MALIIEPSDVVYNPGPDFLLLLLFVITITIITTIITIIAIYYCYYIFGAPSCIPYLIITRNRCPLSIIFLRNVKRKLLLIAILYKLRDSVCVCVWVRFEGWGSCTLGMPVDPRVVVTVKLGLG